jgi:hypothetical protein
VPSRCFLSVQRSLSVYLEVPGCPQVSLQLPPQLPPLSHTPPVSAGGSPQSWSGRRRDTTACEFRGPSPTPQDRLRSLRGPNRERSRRTRATWRGHVAVVLRSAWLAQRTVKNGISAITIRPMGRARQPRTTRLVHRRTARTRQRFGTPSPGGTCPSSCRVTVPWNLGSAHQGGPHRPQASDEARNDAAAG